MSPEAIFSQNFISLFWGLFNDETDLRVPTLAHLRSPWDVPGIQGLQPWLYYQFSSNRFMDSDKEKKLLGFSEQLQWCLVCDPGNKNWMKKRKNITAWLSKCFWPCIFAQFAKAGERHSEA
jgi:hypothetical protein